MSYASGEHERLISNLIRIGVITSVDLVNARATVDAGGVPSDGLPWLAMRAGTTRTWSPPTIGEQVVVLSPYGDMANGIILLGLYQDAHAAPSAGADINNTTYPDGSTVEYDSASNTLTVNVAAAGNVIINCKIATVNAETSVTLDTPEAVCTGNLTVQKKLTYLGGMAGSNSGAGATAVITGGMTLTGGDVVVDGIGVKSHHHVEHDGPPTGPSQA